jgi:predicted LPLAT superfamily acyltransferase
MPPLVVGAISAAAPSPPLPEGKLSTESHRWSQVAERGSLWGMRFTAWSYRWLGRRACGVLVHGIVAYFFVTDRKGRRASAAYLRRVFATPKGRAALGRAPGRWHSFLHYREFALSIVDRIGIWFGHVEDFNYEMIGEEHLDRVAEQGRGAILIGAHLGSFDALRMLAERKKSIVNVLMFTANAERINTLFRELSPDMDARVIRVDPESVESVFAIRECLRRGELVAILGDRIEPGEQNRAVRIPLFGDWVELSKAPFLLAALLDCPVLMILAFREQSGRYSVFAEKLADRVRLPRHERDKAVTELLASYASRLEFYCQRYPFHWFNFFDYWKDEAR